MVKYLNIELNSQRKALLWILSLSGLLAKILIESILILFNQLNTPFAIIVRFLISLVISIPLILLFYWSFKSKLNDFMVTIDYYFRELWQILLLNLVVLLLSAFLPEAIISGGTPDRVIDIIYINIFAFIGLYLSVFSYNFIIKWLWIRRFSKTKSYIRILVVLTLIFIFTIEIPNLFNHIYPEDIQQNSILLTFSIIFNLFLIVLSWLASGKTSWIANLKLSDKWKLVGISLILIILESIFFIKEMKNSGDGSLSNAIYFIIPAGTLLGISSMLLMIYSIRSLLSAFLAMPTSAIIEKKANEISSITYLNRLVSQSVDLDNLIDSVTKLALYSSGASAVWTDIKNKTGEKIIKSCEQMNKEKFSCDSISEELTNRFYNQLNAIHFIEELIEPLYIESIKEFNNPAINEIERMLGAKSLIIMPLLSGYDRIGTLYLTHPIEYGFELDYMNILKAFSDNINIAIENIRLLEVSIEQERYKKELMIARDIESRLIPTSLPVIRNYSLAGLTIQADEVGGDYFDLVYLYDSKACLIIADVSGKGMSAAFYMVLLKGVALSVAGQSSTPKQLLENINRILFKQMEKKVFITISALKIENNEGLITIARAGHMPFLLVRENQIMEHQPHGLGIGLVNPAIFNENIEEQKIQLNDKDIVAMYSDGLTEINYFESEEEDFLKQILKKSVYNNSDDVLASIKYEINNIKKSNNITDDMTVVSLIYNSNI
jgi:serine phosphatase RsbU (regulator of sigma subunit)